MKKKSSDRFLIVMSILTFIVVLVGATFAYFTASARSEENAVDTGSHFVQIDYTEGKVLSASELIPATRDVALFSYHGLKVVGDNVSYTDNEQCIDDNGYEICSLYSFEVTNLGSIEQHLGAFVTVTSNYFHNLKYVLYNVTDVTDEDTDLEKYNKKVEISSGYFPKTYDDYGSFTGRTLVYVIGASDQVEQTIAPEATQRYEMVIWLDDPGEVQEEQLLSFSGSITVSLTDQEHVYGYIEKANG